MTKNEFTSILKEYNFPSHVIGELWDTRTNDDLTEDKVRDAAEYVLPMVRTANIITESIERARENKGGNG